MTELTPIPTPIFWRPGSGSACLPPAAAPSPSGGGAVQHPARSRGSRPVRAALPERLPTTPLPDGEGRAAASPTRAGGAGRTGQTRLRTARPQVRGHAKTPATSPSAGPRRPGMGRPPAHRPSAGEGARRTTCWSPGTSSARAGSAGSAGRSAHAAPAGSPAAPPPPGPLPPSCRRPRPARTDCVTHTGNSTPPRDVTAARGRRGGGGRAPCRCGGWQPAGKRGFDANARLRHHAKPASVTGGV